LKNSTLVIVPSGSEAETSNVIVAGAVNELLLPGELMLIKGG